METAPAKTAPQAFLQLAGHPVRWRLLADLVRSDCTVRELTGLSEQPQSLVSYHLGKLREARVVSARRSSADGRDAYYSVDLARLGSMLSVAGGALHPGLRLAFPTPNADGAGAGRVLFLCSGNSARSQMAEALLRSRSGGRVEVLSAGSKPKAVHPNAVRVMREEYAVDLTTHRSKHLDEFSNQRFDRVITLCDRVREVCPEFPGGAEPVHWSMADPAAEHAGDDDEASYPAFRQTAAELDTRIGFLLFTLATPTATDYRSKQ